MSTTPTTRTPSPPRTTPRAPRFLRCDAAAIADGEGLALEKASILLELSTTTDSLGWHSRTLALGPTAEVTAHPANRAADLLVISCPDSTLIPGLVNAHTHLDLTHIGPQPHDPEDGFVPWVDMIRTRRHTEVGAIAASVRLGIELSRAAGTVAIGDIAGAPKARASLTPWRTMHALGVRGVSYIEFFAIGRGTDAPWGWIESLLRDAGPPSGTGTALGLQPHATNTVALNAYRRAIDLAAAAGNLPLCTHLAETPEEREFIAHAAGPQRELLERFDLWTDDILDHIGRGRHPVAHLQETLLAAAERTGRPMLVAHVNDADDEAVRILAESRAVVVYCPHASTYFGAPARLGPHRYRDMLAAGIPVALGTDSIVNLPPDSAQPGAGMSIIREARMLYQRDLTDPTTLLAMATLHGAAALGLDPRAFRFALGHPVAGILKFPGNSLREVLIGSQSPKVLFADNNSGPTVTIP
ncbi:MAG: amidohydrolase family protein [Phycisphaerales bacterium]